MMTRRKNDRSREAFTLLELMIVLVILVLLAAVAGRRLLRTQKKAEINIAKTQIAELEAALQDYNFDVRTYPSTEDGLQALVEQPSDERSAEKWDGPYLNDSMLPEDPWGNPYEYEYPPSRNVEKPDIWSIGPDSEADTDDDVGNWPAGSGGGGEEGAPDQDAGEDRAGSRDRSSQKREAAPPREPAGGGSRSGGSGGGRTGGGRQD